MSLFEKGLFNTNTKIEGESGNILNIDESGKITVTTHDVNITGTPNVAISGTPNVAISGTPNVAISSGSVGITGSPTVSIAGQTVYAAQSGAYIMSGTVTFPSAQSVNIASQSQNLNCAITNASIPITHTGDLDVNITNADLTISGEVTFPSAQDVTVTNADITVSQTGDWTITNVDEIVLQKERWAQTGSTIINVADANVDDETIYTVTSGKTLYISSVTLGNVNGTLETCTLLDNGSTGTSKLAYYSPINFESKTVEFKTPLKFTTNVYCNTTDRFAVSFSGWEE